MCLRYTYTHEVPYHGLACLSHPTHHTISENNKLSVCDSHGLIALFTIVLGFLSDSDSFKLVEPNPKKMCYMPLLTGSSKHIRRRRLSVTFKLHTTPDFQLPL